MLRGQKTRILHKFQLWTCKKLLLISSSFLGIGTIPWNSRSPVLTPTTTMKILHAWNYTAETFITMRETWNQPSLVHVKARRTIVSAEKMVAQENNHKCLLWPLFWLSWVPNSTSLRSSLTSSMSESFAAWISLPWILSSFASLLLLIESLAGQIKPVIFQRRMPT